MASISGFVSKCINFLTHLDYTESIVLVLIVVGVGVCCMAGYGSKLNW